MTAVLTPSRGFFGQGDMQREFEQAAFALQKGEVSARVETASGVHLIQRWDHIHMLDTVLILTITQHRLE
jgi:hypothetical protein